MKSRTKAYKKPLLGMGGKMGRRETGPVLLQTSETPQHRPKKAKGKKVTK